MEGRRLIIMVVIGGMTQYSAKVEEKLDRTQHPGVFKLVRNALPSFPFSISSQLIRSIEGQVNPSGIIYLLVSSMQLETPTRLYANTASPTDPPSTLSSPVTERNVVATKSFFRLPSLISNHWRCNLQTL